MTSFTDDMTSVATPGDRLASWLEPTWIESETGFPWQAINTDPAYDSPEVVITTGGLAVTESQVLQSIAFAEFLAGHAFTANERELVRDTTIAEFEDAATALNRFRDLLEIGSAAQTIPTLSPIVRAKLRVEAITKIVIGQERSGLPPSPTVTLVHRYNPVLTVDVERSIVVSDDAVLAWGRLRKMIADSADLAFEWNEAAFRREVETNFANWPVERRHNLAEANSGLISVMTGLRHLDDDQLQDLAETVANQTLSARSPEIAATALGQVGRVNDLIASIRQRLTTNDPESVARQLNALRSDITGTR